jgi:hypothetical protein
MQAKLIALLVVLLLIAGLVAAFEYEKGQAERQAAIAREAQRVVAQQQEVIRAKERNMAAIKKKTQASQTIQNASDIVEQQIDDLPRPTILEGDHARVARSLIALFNCNGYGMQQNKGICSKPSGSAVLPGSVAPDPASVEPVAIEDVFDEWRKVIKYAIELEGTDQCWRDSQPKK